MKPLRLALLLLSLVTMNVTAEPLPEELVSQLTSAIRLNCPEAVIENTGDRFIAQYHPPSGDTPGPQSKAFYLEIRLKTGAFGGDPEIQEELQKAKQKFGGEREAALPEPVRNALCGLPFLNLVFDYPRTADGCNHYWIYFSFPRIDSNFVQAVWKALPKGSPHSPEGQLSIYSMETQLGYTACREFTNGQGKPIQQIHYRLGTRSIALVRFYAYDAQQRIIWEGKYSQDLILEESRETVYGEKGRITLAQTRDHNGVVRYKAILMPKGKSYLSYDASGERVISVEGVVPDDIDRTSVEIIQSIPSL